MNESPEKISIGISACLLGSPVRYDGGHKRNDYVEKTLGKYFDFIPFCPEIEIGMGVPRQPIRLVEEGGKVRAKGVKNSLLDVTARLIQVTDVQSVWHKRLSGYILKKDSPSCGMERVKLFNEEIPRREGVGIYAQRVMENFPLLPVEEEGRLGDPVLRENFIRRVYLMKRWQQLIERGLTANALIAFHSQHKLIIMSHDQNACRELGRLVAGVDRESVMEVANEYVSRLMSTLRKLALDY